MTASKRYSTAHTWDCLGRCQCRINDTNESSVSQGSAATITEMYLQLAATATKIAKISN